jgi:DNA-binding FadR family transcriptional regulator
MAHISTLPPRETAVAACARAIRSAILEGEISAGSHLPPERTLAARFGVNRVTVRGALARLEATGLVRSRQGSGYLVGDYRRVGGPDLIGSLVLLAKEKGDPTPIAADLLRVRRHLARAVLETIASDSDIDARHKVQLAIAGFVELVSTRPPIAMVADEDLEVTAALVTATGSQVLQLCLNPIAGVVRALPMLRDAMYRNPLDNAAGWNVLGAWLLDADPKGIDAILAELARRDEATLSALRGDT